MSEGVSTTRLATMLDDFRRLRVDGQQDTGDGCTAGPQDVSVGEMLECAEHAGFGFVAALLALVSIPLVGLTVPFGLAIAGLGVQMMVGKSRPWLPATLERRRVSRSAIQALSARLASCDAKMARIVRPRLEWMTAGPFWTLCGAGLVIQGLSLTLPIPGADWLFVAPIVLYGAGLLERDGVLIILCHLITLTQLVLAFVFWRLIAGGFVEAYRWVAGGT